MLGALKPLDGTRRTGTERLPARANQIHLFDANTSLSEWKIIKGIMLIPVTWTGPVNYCVQEIAGHCEGNNTAS